MKAQIEPGGVFCDDRGTLRYMNEVNFEDVRRFYQVENHERGTIRAWHGHKHEAKYVWVTKGSAIVCHIAMEGVAFDEGKAYHHSQNMTRVVLSDKQPKLLYIPEGNYNGFKTLEEDTRVIFFSTSTLAQSADDDIRLEHDALGTNMWKVIPR